MLVNHYLILLYSYLCYYLDVLACMSSYLFISTCASHNFLFSSWYVIRVHIFQLHQSRPFFSLWDILISFRLGLCSLSNHSMKPPFQWNKAYSLHCTPHSFPMMWKSQSSMELVRNIRAFLASSFWIVFYRVHPYFWVLIFSVAEYQGWQPFFGTCYTYLSKLWNTSYCHWFTSWCHSTL